MKNWSTNKLVKVAMIAAIYAVLTLVVAPIAYGQLQFRVSEMLTVLPAFSSLAVPGLTIGCCIANLVGAVTGMNPTGYIDAIVGSVATLIAAAISMQIGKSHNKWVRYLLVPLPPVLANAVIVGLELTILFSEGGAFWATYAAMALSVGIGELVVCYVLGIILMRVLEKNDLYKKIF